MILLILDNFISKKDCKKIISYFEKNKKHHLINESIRFNKSSILNLNNMNSNKLINEVFNNLNNKSKLLNNSKIDWCHITKWKKEASQRYHFDESKDTTILSSIIYLNDNYTGGETTFRDGITFKPKLGRALFFDGKYYEHGVSEVTEGERYTIATWYKKI